jgi:hypothetical protein
MGTLLNRRRYMGGERGGILPSGYEQLNYVYSDGNAFVSTLYKPTGNEQITVDTMIDSFPTQNNFIQIFGVRKNAVVTDKNNYWLGIDYGKNLLCRFGTVNPSQTVRLQDVGVRRKFYVDLVSKSISINGVEVMTFPTSNVEGYDKSLFVFSLNSEISITSNGMGLKIYDFVIKKDGFEVCHLVPAKRISDNYIGMYDIVADVFRIKSGTGSFIGG